MRPPNLESHSLVLTTIGQDLISMMTGTHGFKALSGLLVIGISGPPPQSLFCPSALQSVSRGPASCSVWTGNSSFGGGRYPEMDGKLAHTGTK